MMFLGDRTGEIIYRASNREVTAMVTMHVPGMDKNVTPNSFGAIIKDGELFTPQNTREAFSQAAHVWKWDDTCVSAAERSPAVLDEIRRSIQDRTSYLNSGRLRDLTNEEQETIFDCEDVIDSATGIAPRISIDFSQSVQTGMLKVTSLPFEKLKQYLLILAETLQGEGGALHDVVIAHKSAMSAADYYKISAHKFHPGWRRSAGQAMIDRATNALASIGIPHGNNPPKPRYN